jgi:acetyl esterase
MPLDPQVVAVLEKMKAAGLPDYSELSAPEARALYIKGAKAVESPLEPVARVANRSIPGPAGEIAVRLYSPSEKRPLPLLVFYHGGGWTIGNLDTHDNVCRQLANRARCAVMSVDYRLAPEHKFPAAVDDAFAALRWAADNAAAQGWDASRVAVGGDSAGGNLAAVCALLARDAGGPALAFQLLVYPATAKRPESRSHHAFAEGHLLTRRAIRWFMWNYLRDEADCEDWRWAPLAATDLTRLPPALVIVAGHDPLLDEGIAYAEQLRRAGNSVKLSNYQGMIHAFFRMTGVVDEARRAVDEAGAALAAAFAARR